MLSIISRSIISCIICCIIWDSSARCSSSVDHQTGEKCWSLRTSIKSAAATSSQVKLIFVSLCKSTTLNAGSGRATSRVSRHSRLIGAWNLLSLAQYWAFESIGKSWESHLKVQYLLAYQVERATSCVCVFYYHLLQWMLLLFALIFMPR